MSTSTRTISRSLEDTRTVVREEVHQNNHHQVYSTAGEVPAIRFANARKAGSSLFRPFALPKPYKSIKGVLRLRTTRTLEGYRFSLSPFWKNGADHF